MKDWWTGFFGGVWMDLAEHARTLTDGEREAKDVLRLLRPRAGARLLDVPCGWGRHAVPLARMGFDVTGVDLTAGLLEKAGRLSGGAGVRVRWVRRDMRRLPWKGAFDGAYCWFGSFGYFDDRGDRDFLSAVRRALRPGGRFALGGLLTLEGLLPRFQPRSASQFGPLRLLEERTFDTTASRVEGTWTVSRGGCRRTGRTSIRVYSCRELAALFREAGFGKVRVLDLDTGKPFRLGGARAVVVGEVIRIPARAGP